MMRTKRGKAEKAKEESAAARRRAAAARRNDDSDNELKFSDSDIEVIAEPDDVFEDVMKKGQKRTQMLAKKREEEIKEINKLGELDTDCPSQPEMYYPIPVLDDADRIFNTMKVETSIEITPDSPVQTPKRAPTEVVCIDEEGPSSSASGRTSPEVSLIVTDLVAGHSKLEPMTYSETKFSSIAARLAREWKCDEIDVLFTLNGEPLTDFNKTPADLLLASDRVYTLTAVRNGHRVMPLTASSSSASAAPLDPSLILLRFQMANRRPVMVPISKTRTFAQQTDAIAMRLKIARISRFVFDNENVGEDETAESLGMEAEDCVDVYA